MIVLFPFQVFVFVSNKLLKWGLLKWLLVYPMNNGKCIQAPLPRPQKRPFFKHGDRRWCNFWETAEDMHLCIYIYIYMYPHMYTFIIITRTCAWEDVGGSQAHNHTNPRVTFWTQAMHLLCRIWNSIQFLVVESCSCVKVV